MSAAGRRDQLLEERKERVFKYLKDKVSINEIMAREGIDERTAKELKREARRKGLPASSGVTSQTPYGITDESRQFRIHLGDRVRRMLDNDGYHQLEVSRILGLTQKTSSKLRGRASFPHDWKLSELERMAKSQGWTFPELMLRMLQPDQFATKEEREAWNSALKALNIG